MSAQLAALYQAPLGEFLARRKELAAQLKKAGDRDLAERVAKLPKPSPAAWVVNQLSLREARGMARLTELGSELRAVMRAGLAGDADAKTKLATCEAAQRRQVAELLEQAKSLLAEHASSSDTVLERVRTTLTTISITGEWGGHVPGQLSKELDPPSVEQMAELLVHGQLDPPPVRPSPTTERSLAPSGPSAEELRRRELSATVTLAEQQQRAVAAELAQRTTERDRAARAERQRVDERSAAQAVVESLEARLDKARSELLLAHAEEARAHLALEQLSAEVERAQMRAAQAADALDEARAALAQCSARG